MEAEGLRAARVVAHWKNAHCFDCQSPSGVLAVDHALLLNDYLNRLTERAPTARRLVMDPMFEKHLEFATPDAIVALAAIDDDNRRSATWRSRIADIVVWETIVFREGSSSPGLCIAEADDGEVVGLLQLMNAW